MPRGSKHGERRVQRKRIPRQKQGYLGKDVAAVANRSPSTITHLCKQGLLEQHEDGSITKESAHIHFRDEYILAGILEPSLEPEGYYRQIEPEVVRGNRAESPDEGRTLVYDFEAERAKLTHMQARKMEIEVEKELGNLVPWDEVEYTVTATYTEFVQSILTLADRLTPLVVGIEDERTIHETVQEIAESLIQTLSNKLGAMIDKHYGDVPHVHAGANGPAALPALALASQRGQSAAQDAHLRMGRSGTHPPQ